MHVFSWFNCEFVLLYYVCMLGMSEIVLIGKQNGQQDIAKTFY